MISTMIVEAPNGGFETVFLYTDESNFDYMTVHSDFLNEAKDYIDFQKDLERQLLENLSKVNV